MIPAGLGWGSGYPTRASVETVTTEAATTKSKPPAIWAAILSARAASDFERNRQRTISAESSSIALSPPNPRRAGLRAAQAAASAIAASAVIQMIVKTCSRSTRRRTSGSRCGTARDTRFSRIVSAAARGHPGGLNNATSRGNVPSARWADIKCHCTVQVATTTTMCPEA
jgi:hypothetical protein